MKIAAHSFVVFSLVQPFVAANESGCVATFEDGKDYFPVKAVVENSKQWAVSYESTYKIVENIAAGESYLLYQCGTPVPADAESYDGVFSIPLQDSGVVSTTMIPFFEILGAREAISVFLGYASWVSSPCMAELFDQGLVAEVQDPYNVTNIDPSLLDVPSFVEHTGGTAMTTEIKVSSSEEDENLAHFEWIKFFALFFNLEEKANEIFTKTKDRYTCAEQNAGILACDGKTKPVILWGSYSEYCGGWDVATCPNYYCEFAENCQAEILSSEDQGSFYSDACFRNYMTTEEFIEFGKDADIWIYTSPDFDNAFAMFEANLTDFVSIQNEQVFDTEGGGAGAWFEQRLVEPGKFTTAFHYMRWSSGCDVSKVSDVYHRSRFLFRCYFARFLCRGWA
jgi:hypothetical protein